MGYLKKLISHNKPTRMSELKEKIEVDIKELKAQVYDLNVLLSKNKFEYEQLINQIGELNNIILQNQVGKDDTNKIKK